MIRAMSLLSMTKMGKGVQRQMPMQYIWIIVFWPISAIRRLCDQNQFKDEENISFQLHAYRLLQEAGKWYLVRVFKDTNQLAAHARRNSTRKKSTGDYGQHNTWAWKYDDLDKPWAKAPRLFVIFVQELLWNWWYLGTWGVSYINWGFQWH